MPKRPKLPKGFLWRGGIIYARCEVAGVDHKCSLRGVARSKIVAARNAWVEGLKRAAPKLGESRRSWQDVVELWDRDFASGVKPSVRKRYLCSLRMVHPILGHLFLDQIGRAELAAIAGRSGPSIATKRRDLDAVAVVLRAAETRAWIDQAPSFDRVRRGMRERREPIRPPSDQEVAAVLVLMPDPFRRLIDFLDRTGMRMEEAASLERASVDWQKAEAQLWETKTSRPRRIVLRTHVADAFAIVEKIPHRIGCKWLFYHARGERFQNVSSRFAGYVRRAMDAKKGGALKRKFRLHDLRHRFAYRWLTSGGDIYELSKHLGHANVKVTDAIYGGWVRQSRNTEPEQQSEVG